jgi:large subunit ribosomal protein L24
MHLRRNDIVKVISGDERGKQGKVLRVMDERRVLVEGVNFVWKHLRRSQQHPHGARIQKEAPMHPSKLAVVCPACEKAVKTGHRKLDTGESVRVCKSCKQPIAART